MEGPVPAQEINMDLPMARLETVLGTQSPIKRGIVNLSMEGQDPAPGKGREATMSSQEGDVPRRSLLKSWSLRISPSSLFLIALSSDSRLVVDLTRLS